MEKCEFVKMKGKVLGHSISQTEIQVDPNKITIVKRVLIPQNMRDVRSFLGLAGYYRSLIKDFNKVALPLFELLEKYSEFFLVYCLSRGF